MVWLNFNHFIKENNKALCKSMSNKTNLLNSRFQKLYYSNILVITARSVSIQIYKNEPKPPAKYPNNNPAR